LRAAAEQARGRALAVDTAVTAFESAAAESDLAAHHLDYLITQAHTRIGRDHEPATDRAG
jgi:hypothetical protein